MIEDQGEDVNTIPSQNEEEQKQTRPRFRINRKTVFLTYPRATCTR